MIIKYQSRKTKYDQEKMNKYISFQTAYEN